MAQPRVNRLEVNGTTLAVHEWGQPSSQPSILLAHATGFHARCWDQVIDHLEGRHVIALDQRGHGQSAADDFASWRVFAEDLQAVLRALRLGPCVAVGHSMGGYACAVAAAQASELFQRLILIDPVIFAPFVYEGADTPAPAEQHPIASRRDVFESSDSLYQRYSRRVPFSLFTEEVLRDYCNHALRPAPESGLSLACPPVFEAKIYTHAFSDPAVLDLLAQVSVPVTVVRAIEPSKPEHYTDFRYSPTWPRLAEQFPRGRDLHWPELTHFMPMQDPQRVARLILERHG